eukprot:UN03938
MSVADIVPLLDYLRDPDVQEKIETAVEIGRQFTFSNGSITVNTGALLAAGALALLGLAALLFFLFSSQDSGDTGGSGYGYGYETQDYGYGDSYAHSRSGESFSDVRHLLDKNVASNPASAGLHALASSWSNTASSIANNLVR